MNSLKQGTIIDLLRWRAINQPDRQAYTFLADGEREEGSLSYTDLDYQARKIGGLLQQHAAAGSRVLLLYPAGLEFVAAFFGALYAGMIPIPAPQPHPNKTLVRLETISEDASASLALVTSSTMAVAEKLFATIPKLRNLRWLVTDRLDDGFADEFQAESPKSDEVAVLQYTSGSTSLPTLHSPLTVFGGDTDPIVKMNHLSPWRELTTSRFNLQVMKGDHFFLHTVQPAILKILTGQFEGILKSFTQPAHST